MEEEKKEKKEESNVMAIISYIGFLCLIPILNKEKDEFTLFHAKQGLVLFIAEAATSIAFFLVPFLLFFINLLWLAWFVLSVIGILNVLNKKKKEIPLLGKFAEKIKI